MDWQRKKGTVYIRCKEGMRAMECNHYINYPFVVHREARINEETKEISEGRRWTITHMPSGHSIGRFRRLLKSAKALADDLKQWDQFYLVEPVQAMSREDQDLIYHILNDKHLSYAGD